MGERKKSVFVKWSKRFWKSLFFGFYTKRTIKYLDKRGEIEQNLKKQAKIVKNHNANNFGFCIGSGKGKWKDNGVFLW